MENQYVLSAPFCELLISHGLALDILTISLDLEIPFTNEQIS
jgi:hypothetical protein